MLHLRKLTYLGLIAALVLSLAARSALAIFVSQTDSTGTTMASAIGGTTPVRKVINESVTSSTTLQNDDVLQFSVGANEVWTFSVEVFYEGSTAGDLKVGFSAPVGTVGEWSLSGCSGASVSVICTPVFVTSTAISSDPAYSVGGVGAGTGLVAHLNGVFTAGASSGTVIFQWAQATSDGTATIVHANSTIVAHRIA